ncbi:O-antigen ligase family protein [Knoellia sp. CPCC 206453]|uniref:O-antigen ligase family protein n=1 Tax=Knoellia pratensis TaxID=3404796 RepID=UPI00361A5CEF
MMRRSVVLSFISLLLAAMTYLTIAISPVAGLGLALLAALLPWSSAVDGWRAMTLVAFCASLIRARSLTAIAMPETLLLFAQFAPLALSTLLLLLTRTRRCDAHNSARAPARVLVALAAWSLLSAMWSIAPRESATQASLFVLVAIFLFRTVVDRWQTQSVVYGDLAMFYVVIVLITIIGLVGGVIGQEWAFLYGARFQGLLINPNYTGILAAAAFTIGLYLARKRNLPFVAPAQLALFAAILWTGSRGALAGVVVGSTILLMSRPGRRLRPAATLGIPATVTVALTVFPNGLDAILGLLSRNESGFDFTSGRLSLWLSLIGVWRDNWLLGTGYRTTELFTGESGFAAHNVFLQFLVETGPVGVGLVATIFILAWRNRAREGATAPLAAGVVCVGLIELTESSLTGFGNSVALIGWMVVLLSASSEVPFSPPNPRRRHALRGRRDSKNRNMALAPERERAIKRTRTQGHVRAVKSHHS